MTLDSRKPMRRRSARLAALLRIYAKKRAEFLTENPWCALGGCEATEVHHKAGRIGDLLLDTSKWLPVCHDHHVYVTEHPREAIAKGWSLSRLSVVPGDNPQPYTGPAGIDVGGEAS